MGATASAASGDAFEAGEAFEEERRATEGRGLVFKWCLQ
jgi:hypothetical protein